MKHSIHRRAFILKTVCAAAGALCAGGTNSVFAADAAERSAFGFIRKYSDTFLVRSEAEGVTRLVAEVRSVSQLGTAFHRARRHCITELRVAGTTATFQIGRRTFEVENLCPEDFAAWSTTSKV